MTLYVGQPPHAPVTRKPGLGIVLSLAVALILFGALGPNLELTTLASVTLATGVFLLWRPGQPPILLYIFLVGWLQASMVVFQATLDGIPVSEFSRYHGDEARAVFLTELAVVAMAVGMKLGAGAFKPSFIPALRAAALSLPLRRWFVAYAASAAVATAARLAATHAPGLSQILGGLAALHWAFFFTLAFAFFVRRAYRAPYFYLAFAWEFMTGIGGYFSDFKVVFIVSLLALVASGVRITTRFVALSVAVAFAGGVVMVAWTAIKPTYRIFVSGGERAQIVTVGYGERVEKLAELAGGLDGKTMGEGVNTLMRRIGYVDFFSLVLDNVPSVVPHQHGAITMDAISRPFTPRILFPGKSVINDSERTRLFTGVAVAGAEQGASISIGWPGELYIDFGAWLMIPAAVGLGLCFGLVQRFFLHWRWSRGLLGMAVSIALLLGAAAVETSLTKMLGGLAASFIAAWLVIRFIPRRVRPWWGELRR